jgi:hypothetical protein
MPCLPPAYEVSLNYESKHFYSIFQNVSRANTDAPPLNVKLYENWLSRDSSVGIATGYGLDNRGVGVRVPEGARNFSSPRRPDRLWGPPSLLSNEYRWHFPRG